MIVPKISTNVNGKEFRKLSEMLSKLRDAYVSVGIHEDAGQYDDGTSVVMVALWNEFGTQKSPERSFFRSAIDANEGLINKWREEAIMNIIEKDWTVKKALEMIGFRVMIIIQNKIKSNVPPPNKPSTVKSKQASGTAPKSGFKPGFEGRTGTLIDSTRMLRSVTYKVHLG